ncbi:MAG: phosphate regulon sensor histidine kinase PhoR [Betaproteobacteria bacterium]|nr:MAG: phosphate regulon sensor histidine kinase PhoR [Betaproteobacteria bacterium]
MTAALLALALLATLLALALYLQRRQLGRLRRWAAQPRLADPPEAGGAWGEVFDLLHRHRRANLKRRRQLAQLIVRSRRAAQALPYGVTALDAGLRLDWCNDSARAHFGLDAVRDRGAPIANFVRHPDFVAYLAAREFAEPLRLQVSGGTARALSLQLVPFEEEAWLLLSQDVTGAERLEAMRRDFVANVSHELRTPLTVLTGFLETIHDLELEPQRVRDYLDLMAPQAARMRRIIEDLLALSSLEHAPPPPEARVALGALLERLRTETEQLSAGRHRISLSIAGDQDLLGAESELASAFLNLASNAVRYTPEGGEIRLSWRSDTEGGEFAVADTGIGIGAEHLPRLTERFYRADRGRSRESGGTGLGLAIVKHALARHQAVLSIESTPGKGSTFRARFRAARLLPALQKVPG